MLKVNYLCCLSFFGASLLADGPPTKTAVDDRRDLCAETVAVESSSSPRTTLNAAVTETEPSPLPFHQGNYMEFAPRITVVGCGGAGGNAGVSRGSLWWWSYHRIGSWLMQYFVAFFGLYWILNVIAA